MVRGHQHLPIQARFNHPLHHPVSAGVKLTHVPFET
jgi:hypothetical protein